MNEYSGARDDPVSDGDYFFHSLRTKNIGLLGIV